MNFIAGCLLLFMEEENAFWCLTTIVEDLLPGYFSTTMAASQVPLPPPLLTRRQPSDTPLVHLMLHSCRTEEHTYTFHMLHCLI